MHTVISDLHAMIDQTTRRTDLEPDEIARRVAQLERAIRAVETVDTPVAVAPVIKLPAPKKPRKHLRDRVLRLLARSGSGSFSELRLALGEHVQPYELQNALRDLRDRGLAEPTGQHGAVLSGRGKPPTIWRLVAVSKPARRAHG